MTPQDFFYIYSENDSLFYIAFKSDDSLIANLSINAGKIFKVDSIYVDSGLSIFVYENNLNIFAIGKFDNLNKIRVKAKPPLLVKKVFTDVFLGEKLYLPEKDSFYIAGKIKRWDGRIYPSGSVLPPGNYKVRFIAFGINGNGYIQKEGIIKIKSKFEVDTVYVHPEEIVVNDTSLSKASLFFKTNTDLKADIFVINSLGNEIDTVCTEKEFYGSWDTHSIIWDAGKKPFIDNGFYRFKLVLKPLYTDFDTICYSPNFRIINVPVIYDTLDLYIPDKYAHDTLEGRKIYSAKPEYLFSLKPEGRLTPPLYFKINVKRKSAKMPLKVKWRVDYYTVDVDTNITYHRKFYGYIYTLKNEEWRPGVDYKNKVVRFGTSDKFFTYSFYKNNTYIYGRYRVASTIGCCYNGIPNSKKYGIFGDKIYDSTNCGLSCRVLRDSVKSSLGSQYLTLEIYDSTKIVPDTELVITDSLLGISDSGTFYIVDTGAVYKTYTCFYPAEEDSQAYKINFIPFYHQFIKSYKNFTYMNPYTGDTVSRNLDSYYPLSQKIETIDSVSPDTVKKVSLLIKGYTPGNYVIDTLVKFYQIKLNSGLYVYKDFTGKSIFIQEIPVYANDTPQVFEKPVTKWRLNVKIYYNWDLLEQYEDTFPISQDTSREDGIVKIQSTSANFFRELRFILPESNVEYFIDNASIQDTLKWNEDQKKYSQKIKSLDFLKEWQGSNHFVSYACSLMQGKITFNDTGPLPDSGRCIVIKPNLEPEDTSWVGSQDKFINGTGIFYTEFPAVFENVFPDSGHLSKTYISEKYFENYKDSILAHPECGDSLNQMFNYEVQNDSLIKKSNPYLNINLYDSLKIFYINRREHHDLSSENTKFHYSGCGNGINDFLRPYLNLTYHPREYIPLRGKSFTGSYKIYIMREDKIYPVSDSLINVPQNIDTILGYIESSEIAERVKVLLYEYKEGSLGQIRYRDFLIGDLFDPQKNKLTAKSPYARAVIQFSENSFNTSQIIGICPLYPDSMEIEGSEPYIGGNFGPLLYLKPRGAKFQEPEQKPTLYYYFTQKEKEDYNIDLENVRIYAIKEDGSLIPLNTIVSEDPNTGKITLQVMADSFPGEGDAPYFSALNEDETVDGKILIIKEIIYHDNVDIEGVYLPYTQRRNSDILFVGTKEKIKNIYDLKNYILSQNPDTILRVSTLKRDNEFYINFETNLDTLYYFILPGVNHNFLNQFKGNINNFPVAKGTLIDTSFEIKVLPPENPYTGIVKGSLKFYINKPGLIHYVLKNEFGEIIKDSSFNLMPFDTVSLSWNGRINNQKAKEGDYPYEINAFAQNGEMDNKQGLWHVIWNYYAVILNPEDGSFFIPGNDILLNAKVLGTNMQVEWSAYTSFGWEFIGIQNDTLSPVLWHIPESYKVPITLKANPLIPGVPDFARIYPVRDSFPPFINITPVSNFYEGKILWISENGKILIKTEDNESNIDTSYLLVNNLQKTEFKDSLILTSQNLNPGENDIYIYTKDVMNNERDTGFIIGFDNFKPDVEIKFGEPHYVSGDTFFVTPETPESLIAKDKGSGISSIFYKLNNSDYIQINDSVHVMNMQNADLNRLYFYSVDNLGNASETLLVFVKVEIAGTALVKITFPYDSIIFNQNFAIRGCARNVQKWRLLYGYGVNPSNYILLKEGDYGIYDSLTPVDTFPPPQIPDGVYKIRLEGISYQDTTYSEKIVYKGNFEIYDSSEAGGFGRISGDDKFLYYTYVDTINQVIIYLRKYQILDSLIFIKEDTLLDTIQFYHDLTDICAFPDYKIFIFFNAAPHKNSVKQGEIGYIWKGKDGNYNLYSFDNFLEEGDYEDDKIYAVERMPFGNTSILVRDTGNLSPMLSFGNFDEINGFAVKDSICYYSPSFGNKIYILRTGQGTPFDSIDYYADKIFVDEKGLLWGVLGSEMFCFSPFKEKIFSQNIVGYAGITSFYICKNNLLLNTLMGWMGPSKIYFCGYQIQDKSISVFSLNKNTPLKIQKLFAYPSLYNPRKGFLKINFYLPAECRGEVLIYTLSEKLVKRIKFYGRKGLNTVFWDGRNEIGLPARNGVYVALVKVKNGFLKDQKYTKFMIRR